MAFSGLLVQFKYHLGDHGEISLENRVLGMDYFGWTDIHKISIMFSFVLVIFHFVFHWKWYETVLRKNLISKNKQVIGLTIFFTLVAITGIVTWLIKMAGNDGMTRKLFIEIHDKLALVLFVYLILHVTKRFKWFITSFNRIKK